MTTGKSYTWHVGEVFPVSPSCADVVSTIQADGDELYQILSQVSNIPTARLCPVVRWFGDHAKFIAFILAQTYLASSQEFNH